MCTGAKGSMLSITNPLEFMHMHMRAILYSMGSPPIKIISMEASTPTSTPMPTVQLLESRFFPLKGRGWGD